MSGARKDLNEVEYPRMSERLLLYPAISATCYLRKLCIANDWIVLAMKLHLSDLKTHQRYSRWTLVKTITFFEWKCSWACTVCYQLDLILSTWQASADYRSEHLTHLVKNVKIVEFHDYIRNHHEKYIEISTNIYLVLVN